MSDDRRRYIAAILLALFSLGWRRAWEGVFVVAAWYAATARVPHWPGRRRIAVVVPISAAVVARSGLTAALADDIGGRFVHHLNRPITAPPVVLPPQGTGPWRPRGHGPEPVGGNTCVCGASGITDWQAHIAGAATA